MTTPDESFGRIVVGVVLQASSKFKNRREISSVVRIGAQRKNLNSREKSPLKASGSGRREFSGELTNQNNETASDSLNNGRDLTIRRELTVQNKAGFHVRVASLICKTSMKFESKITLAKGGSRSDCKSCLDLLTLMAPRGEKLTLQVEGPDAESAVSAIETLFERKFYEDEFASVEANG